MARRFISVRAIALLVEAKGELEEAEAHVSTLLLDADTEARSQPLMLSAKAWYDLAMRATTLKELERSYQQVDRAVQDLLNLLDQLSFPPRTEWRLQLQLARDWLHISRAKLKLALTSAHLEECQKARQLRVPLDN